MARRVNSLFIGKDYLTEEGRDIKHPGLLRVYATPNIEKITNDPVSLIGLDLETESTTGELRLLGFYDGKTYQHFYKQDFLEILFMYVRMCRNNELNIAYWNRLDPFVLFKQFLIHCGSDSERMEAMNRFGKVSGEYDKNLKEWKILPVIKVVMTNEGYEFGIAQAIRSSIQFFYNRPGEEPNRVWAYDIAALYEKSLETEALGEINPKTGKREGGRLPWYSKVDETSHIVDWARYETDKDYRVNIVLKSNELDARAVYELGYAIQEDFKNAFKAYPRTLISQGSLARSAIVANLMDHYVDIENETERKKRVMDDVTAIGILSHLDGIKDQLGEDGMKDFYCLLTEAYSGGYIEAIRYGYAENGWYADIASAYPGVIQHLYDLRGAKITQGIGTPPRIPNSYCFIRGIVQIPSHINYHPITVKHPIHTSTNIRPVGIYRASYTLDERDLVLELGGTFSDETWYNVETKGELSPLARVCVNFVELRKKFKKLKSSSQYMAKIAANSLYGILFEAVPTYNEQLVEEELIIKGTNWEKPILARYLKKIDCSQIKSDLIYANGANSALLARWHKKGGQTPDSVMDELQSEGIILQAHTGADALMEIDRRYLHKVEERTTLEKAVIGQEGYRAGEFWNPLYASIITARTRVLMSRAANAIERNGGKPIIMMTDSILWQGRFEDMPSDLWRAEKTLGYYEKPAPVSRIVALGSGRYGFTDEEGEKTTKKRGLNASELHAPDGMVLEDDLDWMDALKVLQATNQEKIEVSVRTLVSPGMILGNHKYTWKDLGLVIEDKRMVDAIVGRTKRFMEPNAVRNPKVLATSLVETHSLYLGRGMLIHEELDDGIIDQTLPMLRRMTMAMEYDTRQGRRNKKVNEAMKRQYDTNKDTYHANYEMLRGLGYKREEAKKMCKWSKERLTSLVG